MRNFRLANLQDIQAIIAFANVHWGREHPILNYTKWFVYYYVDVDKGKLHFALCEDDGQISAICGYIPASNKENSDIWMSFLVADPKARWAGTELVEKLPQLTGADCVACVNIKKSTMGLYQLLGWQTGRMSHFFRLADKKHYSIAKVYKKPDNFVTSNIEYSCRLVNGDELDSSVFADSALPLQKDVFSFQKRYYSCPFYKYHVWSVEFPNERKKLYVVIRSDKVAATVVLHIVDIIGDVSAVSFCGSFFQELLDKYDAEYIDCYCAGVPSSLFTEAGFTEREENQDSVIIPLRLVPPIDVSNVEIFYCANKSNGFSIFSGDGDFDRPYTPHIPDCEEADENKTRM